MSTTALSSFKLLLLGRCLRGAILSVVVQYLLLTVFLLFVNFELLHPLNWLAGTLRLVCSWYTWFASILLISAVLLYGVTLTQQHLAERRYCATRYRWLIQNGPRKLLFLGAHLFLGYLTAWLYSGYLHTDYRFEKSTLLKHYNLIRLFPQAFDLPVLWAGVPQFVSYLSSRYGHCSWRLLLCDRALAHRGIYRLCHC